MLTVVIISVRTRPRLRRHIASARCRPGFCSHIGSEVIRNNSSLFTVWLCLQAASSACVGAAVRVAGPSPPGGKDPASFTFQTGPRAVDLPDRLRPPHPKACLPSRRFTSWFVCFYSLHRPLGGRSSCPILADPDGFVKSGIHDSLKNWRTFLCILYNLFATIL